MLLTGNCLQLINEIDDNIVQTIVTSPPYWGLRDYEGEVVRIKERGRHRDLVVRVDNDENLNGKKFDLKGYDLFDKDISVDPGSKVEFNLDGVRAVNGTITS